MVPDQSPSSLLSETWSQWGFLVFLSNHTHTILKLKVGEKDNQMLLISLLTFNFKAFWFMGWMFYYIDQFYTQSFLIGLINTEPESLDQLRLT